MKKIVIASIVLSMLLLSGIAAAQMPSVLRPGTHPFWASLSFGPAVEVDDLPTQFKLIQTIGYHFNGGADGPALAFDIQESFGKGFTMFTIGPKFVYDIPIIQDLGLYLSPSAMLGYAYASAEEVCVTTIYGSYCAGGDGRSFLDLQFGFEGKLILADRGLVFFRPFTIDVAVNPDGTGIRYDLMFGGGVIF